MLLNLIFIIVGLIICFGGISFRKFVSGIMGFIWGALVAIAAITIVYLHSQGFWGIYQLEETLEDATVISLIIVFACLISALSAWLERLCAAINAFLSSLALFIAIGFLIIQDEDGIVLLFCLAMLASSVISAISFQFYDYSFMILTAFSGAFIASIGGVGLFTGNEVGEVFYYIIIKQRDAIITPVIWSTLILGICGFYVQKGRFRGQSQGQRTDSSKEGSSANYSKQINGITKDVVCKAENVMHKSVIPIIHDIIAEIKSAWTDIKTDQGKAALKTYLINFKYLFIPVITCEVIIPIVFALLPYNQTLYEILAWIRGRASDIALGVLIYFILTKTQKSVLYTSSYTLQDVFYMFCYNIAFLALPYQCVITYSYGYHCCFAKKLLRKAYKSHCFWSL